MKSMRKKSKSLASENIQCRYQRNYSETSARTCEDDVAKALIARIKFDYNLVAPVAKYHRDCQNFFLNPINGGQIGRPKD